MSGTVAHSEMKEFARGFEKIFHSAVCSGVVGDARHAARGGYHIGRKYQSASNYSVIRPEDRDGQGPADGSSAVDMTMSGNDMRLATARLAAAYRDTNDPRRKYINAFNGWEGGANAIRYDVYARKTKIASPDHKWHVHLEQRRRYITDAVANEAIWSILRGESVAQWLKSRGLKSVTKPAPVTAPAKPMTAPAKKKPAAPATVAAPPYPGRELVRNDNLKTPDPAVRQWQQRMLFRGWASIGKVDGLPGPAFERVVKAWQQEIGLPADGRVGPKTWPTPWTRPLTS